MGMYVACLRCVCVCAYVCIHTYLRVLSVLSCMSACIMWNNADMAIHLQTHSQNQQRHHPNGHSVCWIPRHCTTAAIQNLGKTWCVKWVNSAFLHVLKTCCMGSREERTARRRPSAGCPIAASRPVKHVPETTMLVSVSTSIAITGIVIPAHTRYFYSCARYMWLLSPLKCKRYPC